MKDLSDKSQYSATSWRTRLGGIWLLLMIVLMCGALGRWNSQLSGCEGYKPDTVSVKRDTVIILVCDTVRDTVPQLVTERVVRYVKVPVILEHEDSDVLQNPDSVNMAIVQREYSDDSTYTAWVSGVAFGDTLLPQLDSIHVRRLTQKEYVKEAVVVRQRSSRLHVGVTGGYGYGLRSRSIEPFVGIGISYSLWPP